MLAKSNLRAAARMTAVVVATVFCVSGTLARAPARLDLTPDMASTGLPPPDAPPQVASFGSASTPGGEPHSPPARGPFGLTATHTGGLAERWRILQPLIITERQILARCRAEPAMCTPAAAKFGAVVAAGQARDGLARLGEINRAVNLAIRPMSDLAQYGVPDIWASPLMTFTSGAGDCEDYAIAKYVALLETGMAPDDVRLVVVYNRPAHEGHMVTAARLDGRWFILDNRTMRLIADADIDDLTPLALLDGAVPAPAVAAATPVQQSPATGTASLGAWDAAMLVVNL